MEPLLPHFYNQIQVVGLGLGMQGSYYNVIPRLGFVHDLRFCISAVTISRLLADGSVVITINTTLA